VAKYLERIEARKLRKAGKSIVEISKMLKVSKSSVSIWCRDIVLTEKQVKRLFKKEIVGGIKGRKKAWEWHRNERIARERKHRNKGLKRIRAVSCNDLFMIGLSLYWAEGSKKDGVVSLVNSDLEMMSLFVEWLEKCFGVDRKDLICRVGINVAHENRVMEVEKYWSEELHIPLCQFRKASLKKVKNKKIYANHDNHYGSLVIKVRKSTNMFYEILGSIAGLKKIIEVKSRIVAG